MYDLDSLADLLKRVKHFKSLDVADRRAIIALGEVLHFPAEATIFTEGAPCAGMFVLLKGQVQLRKFGPQGQEHILAVINPVIMFNEVPVLDGGPNVATAVASQESVTWRIPCEAFHTLLRRYPPMGIGLLRVMATRNRFLISQYEDLSFRSVVARTAKLLLDLSGDGQNPIDRRANPNVELAARVATGPEPFSRSLGMLRRSGYIQCTRRIIRVLYPAALAEMAAVELL
ncbi:MAG: Crp/Fnr family transcriptional regulator [Anaerolineae bacterium]|nr:Crp/Fnr family transcriptional regulator [Anaerolineae bacterium]